MIKDGFLTCICNKKIQPININDTISATVYCSRCKTYFKVLIAYGKLYEMERAEQTQT